MILSRVLGVEAIAKGHPWSFILRWAAVGLAWALLVTSLTGCVASSLAEVVNQLGDNTSTVCVTVNTVYGTGKALRTNVANGKVKCDMDGMSVDTGEKKP